MNAPNWHRPDHRAATWPADWWLGQRVTFSGLTYLVRSTDTEHGITILYFEHETGDSPTLLITLAQSNIWLANGTINLTEH